MTDFKQACKLSWENHISDIPCAYDIDIKSVDRHIMDMLTDFSTRWESSLLQKLSGPIPIVANFANTSTADLQHKIANVSDWDTDTTASDLMSSIQIPLKLTWQLALLFPSIISFINSGNFWYKAGTSMGWHTNSNFPGVRIYASYATEEHSSYFRYKLNDEIVTLYDNIGWNIRLFTVSKANPLWHCVGAPSHRLSLGFNATANI